MSWESVKLGTILTIATGKYDVNHSTEDGIYPFFTCAMLPFKSNTFSFDDEGNYGQRTVLINDGVLKQYMYDRLTAVKDGRDSTGNGRRESYQDKPIPRMSNTFIASGKDDPEIIIKSTPSGLLVKKMGGGYAVISTGSKGFLVIPFECVINSWVIFADASGSIVVDVKM